MTATKKQSNTKFLFLVGGVMLVLIAGVFFLVKFLMNTEESNRQKKPTMVTLVAPPPPPPKVEEKIPEPEKQEEKIEEPEEKPAETPEPPKDAPPPQNLGLDANAGLGSDGFGLEARRGGSNLIGGNGPGSPFAWYAGQISTSLQKTANEIIQREGGIPQGKWAKVSFEVTVDAYGKITHHAIIKSSGNQKIDDAVKRALQTANTFEPPPPGMPKVMRFAVSLQG